MKKVFKLVLLSGIVAITSCGPSAEEMAAKEKAVADSIAAVEAAKQQAMADSLAAVEAAKQQAKADSVAAARAQFVADSTAAASKKKKK